MDIDLGQATLLGHLQQSEEVGDVGVHAAVAEQAVQVQGSALLLAGVHGIDVSSVLEEGALLNVQRDAGQVLEHHAASADVGVAHLAVAHLSVGQAHVQAGGGQAATGILSENLVQIGGLGSGNGVVAGLALAGGQTKAVHDDESSRSFHD